MGKPDRNPVFNGLCQLLLLLALIHGGRPNARYNWVFFIPISTLCIYSVFFCAPGSTSGDYAAITSLLNLILTASDYILLRNRQPELRKIGQKKATSEMTVKERLMWALSLLATPRGIGWAHEPTTQMDPRPTASRKNFIASQFLWTIFYFVLWDLALVPIRENPSFKLGGPSLAAFGWWRRTVVWSSILTVYCTMSGMYAIASIISVATGLYEPQDWPHIFGSPFNAYTLRKCWGRVWHQILRKNLTTHANCLANALHLPKGTFTTYFKLFTTFFISGVLHATGEHVFFQNFSEGATVQFFLLQAVGIAFEDAVIAIASRLGYKESKAFKLIGFIWVFAWFTFCIPMWLDSQVHSGKMYQEDFSLIPILKSFCENRGIFKMAA
ncbi:hypothetical protein M413DRAFT_440250 [Hebeloma cylindrosporum]|uniref:Wax synthase domain-containing protein n=1 Tax=Hebeloma cylindrosporum TaxID=76867 RepID=A0A0C3CS06_HEBCY|nr:hypothetical protein M413DRAFT_440250 [Hebeloma cylindrosporum h7]